MASKGGFCCIELGSLGTNDKSNTESEAVGMVNQVGMPSLNITLEKWVEIVSEVGTVLELLR